MQLPFLNQTTKSESQREYFLALEINLCAVKAAVWSVINDKTQVLGIGKIVVWDGLNVGSLVNSADKAISDCLEKFDRSEKIDVTKIIFGLPPVWVSEDRILPEKLKLLKAICDQLELKAIGFVVTVEAVVRHLQTQEGVPPTAILLGVFPHDLEVTLVRLGKIDAVQQVRRGSTIGDDVAEGLARFVNVDMLPSRMLLYDSGTDLESVKQTLLGYAWQSPKQRLPFLHFPKVEVMPEEFTIRAVALAGGTEVAKAVGILPDAEVLEAKPEELGFSTQIPESDPEPEPVPESEYVVPTPKSGFKFQISNFKFPTIFIVALLATVLAGTGLIAAYWYLPKAEVIVFVTPKILQDQFDLNVDVKETQSLESVVSGEKSAPATGTKVVGDKASGEVTLYNNTNIARKFAVGTILTTGKLKFSLTETVDVASASGSLLNRQLGKATVKVSAAVVGQEYNLSAGTEFRVGSYAEDDLIAKNEAAFSGGTSQQVKAVSKDDVTKLRAELLEELKNQATQDLVKNVPEGKTLVSQSVTFTTTTEELSSNVNEEAEDIKIKLTVKTKGFALDKKLLEKEVDKHLAPQIPVGYLFYSRKSQDFVVKKVSKDAVALTVDASIMVLPQIDTAVAVEQITGKFPTTAKAYLESLPGVGQIDMVISPRLPSAIATLPRVSTRINLLVRPVE